MTRYAVVDLEATDSSSAPKKKIIQIGIVILEKGQVIDSFTSEINPHEPLTENIIQLTGLTDQVLEQAPDFETIIPEILGRLENSVFVAHNVKFDWGLLSTTLEQYGEKIDIPRIDTVELSRIFFPSFEKYGLEFLKNKLNLKNDKMHTALADAMQTAELFLRIQERILALPKRVLQEIQKHASVLSYETKTLIDDLLPTCLEREEEFDFQDFLAIKKRQPQDLVRNVDRDFAENFKRLGLTKREIQQKISDIILEHFDDEKTTFIQADTGSGKTLAYLISLFSLGKNVLLSTPTKVLQEQVMSDIAQDFQEIFGISTAKLMASSNYISLKKFKNWLGENLAGQNTEIFKMKVLVWLTETKTGELSEISKNVTGPEMFSMIAHQSPEIERGNFDFWELAQASATKVDLLVVNHAYLIEMLKRKSQLFSQRVLVVDEAQRLFTVLENAGQSSIDILDEILDTDIASSKKKRRSMENLIFLLSQKKLNRNKIFMEAVDLDLDNLTDFMMDPEQIYWTEGNTLKSSSADFYDFKKLLPPDLKSIFISGSIALTKEKALLPELLGFSEEDKFYKIPTEKAENQMLLVAKDGLAVKNSSVQDYSDFLAEKINELAQMNLPIIVLFSSRDLLGWTAHQLEKYKLSVGVQRADQHDLLKKQFDAGKFQILLATGAFWEGVDFEKQEKSILVIPRLPFATPDDVLTKKFASKFKNPFYDFNLPMATMKMKQAMGRVNRKVSQKSLVLVLDHRLAGKSYAKRLRNSLEERVPLEILEFDAIPFRIQEFLVDKDEALI